MGAGHEGLFMPWLEVLALQVIQPVDSDAFTISTIYKKLTHSYISLLPHFSSKIIIGIFSTYVEHTFHVVKTSHVVINNLNMKYRSHGKGKGYPLQYSGLENFLDSTGWDYRVQHNWVPLTFTCVLCLFVFLPTLLLFSYL